MHLISLWLFHVQHVSQLWGLRFRMQQTVLSDNHFGDSCPCHRAPEPLWLFRSWCHDVFSCMATWSLGGSVHPRKTSSLGPYVLRSPHTAWICTAVVKRPVFWTDWWFSANIWPKMVSNHSKAASRCHVPWSFTHQQLPWSTLTNSNTSTNKKPKLKKIYLHNFKFYI